jgi:PAS domain S-box-containing protein
LDEKTQDRDELIAELRRLRRQIGDLEGLESRHMEAESALKAANREKEAVLDSISEFVTFQDMNQKILWANRAAAESVGQRRDQMVGRYCYEIWHHRSTPCDECPLPKALETCQIQEGEVPSPSGRFWFMRCYPVQDENGDFIGVVELAQDITGKRRMEEELLKIKKLESIGILAGGIAHDFNNLLSVIIGNISIALSDAKPEDRIYERLVEAREALMRAKDLVHKLLSFSRGEAPKIRPTLIGGLLKNTTRLALSGSDIKCEFSIPEDLRAVSIDEVQIGFVVHNMIMNAREAMPRGGTIKVMAKNANMGKENIHNLREGKYVRVSIEDEGKGIPEDLLEKIFDPYFSTKEIATQKGVGLGLSLSHSIVKKHGGHISVKSEVGAGTIFHAYLPAHEGPVPERDAQPDESSSTKGRILFMDEEEMIRNMAGRMLSRLHYEVVFTRDGDEAIERYRKAMVSGHPFDAVILGSSVCGKMPSNKTLLRLKEIDPEMKIIVSSNHADDPIIKKSEDYGFFGSLVKPYQLEDLGRILNEA